MGTKGGQRPKDAPISDNFNQLKNNELTKEEKKRLQQLESIAKARQARVRNCMERRLLKTQRELEDLKGQAGAPSVSREDADEQSAYEMLQDMRYVYRSVKGRAKLEKLVKGDDKQFIVMVKELMKIESALMAAKIRSKEDPTQANQMVFVVLKGLGDEKKLEELMGDVDMKQITGALNPDGGTYEGG